MLGATENSFQRALHAGLDELRLDYEERPSGIHVASEGFDLRISVQPSRGSAQIRTKGAKGKRRLKELSARMAKHFQTYETPENFTALWNCIVIGLILRGMEGGLAAAYLVYA